MAGNTPISLSKTSRACFIEYYNQIQSLLITHRQAQRTAMEFVDIEYQREIIKHADHIRAKWANYQGDLTRFQDIVVPIVAPQTEAAVTYQSEVFLSDSPIFPVVAPPEYMDAALQMQAKIEQDSIHGGWRRELILFFRDGF